jgi:5-methylcytosine-specific restriction endonuclease McrA
MRKNRRTWNLEQLREAAAESYSIRSVLIKLRLIPAGGNYDAVKRIILENNIDTSHFTGMGWKKGNNTPTVQKRPLNEIMVRGSNYQSFKLKLRLFATGLKLPQCEECHWAKISPDGRLPLELDHINGDKTDNRLENLRVLCSNCHSLKVTHRGRNKKLGWRNGKRVTLKMS